MNYNIVFNNIGTDNSIIITGYLKEYFVNVAEEIVIKLPQIKCPSSKYIEKQSILLSETNVVEVLSQIAMLQKIFLHGLDFINNTFFSRFDKTLAPFLVYFINESLLSGVFPSSLRRAIIQPHFKTGSKTDVIKYWPISILPSFGKFFGNVLNIKFVDYFEKFKVLGKISLVSAVRVQPLMHSYME